MAVPTFSMVCDTVFQLSFCLPPSPLLKMRCPQGKDSKEVKVSCRWNGLWLSAGTKALHQVCPQPASIWKHVRTQQARAVCRALLEAFPRQCYLL